MLFISRCYERECKHYKGIIQPDGTEMSEVHSCTAFPPGIPYEISDGDNLHSEPLEGQDNKITFEAE